MRPEDGIIPGLPHPRMPTAGPREPESGLDQGFFPDLSEKHLQTYSPGGMDGPLCAVPFHFLSLPKDSFQFATLFP